MFTVKTYPDKIKEAKESIKNVKEEVNRVTNNSIEPDCVRLASSMEKLAEILDSLLIDETHHH